MRCNERKNENGEKKNRGRGVKGEKWRVSRRDVSYVETSRRSIEKSSNASGWEVRET